jgi:hypothetical protein
VERAQDGLQHAEGPVGGRLQEQQGALALGEARHAEQAEPDAARRGAARDADPDPVRGFALDGALHVDQVVRGRGTGAGGRLDRADADHADHAGLIGQVLVRHPDVGGGPDGSRGQPYCPRDRQPAEMSGFHSAVGGPTQFNAAGRPWANRS